MTLIDYHKWCYRIAGLEVGGSRAEQRQIGIESAFLSLLHVSECRKRLA